MNTKSSALDMSEFNPNINQKKPGKTGKGKPKPVCTTVLVTVNYIYKLKKKPSLSHEGASVRCLSQVFCGAERMRVIGSPWMGHLSPVHCRLTFWVTDLHVTPMTTKLCAQLYP